MAFNVSEFRSQINGSGLAKTNLFFVTITLPDGLRFIEQRIGTNQLRFLCKTVDLPELNIQVAEIKNKGYGPVQYSPTDLQYPALSTVFMVDGDYGVLKFFHRWMQEIVNYDISGGYLSANGNLSPYEFGYKEDYIGTVDVFMYSASREKFYNYKFGKAFPVTIGNITASWENNDELLNLPITFMYDELTVDGADRGNVSSISNIGAGALESYFGRSIIGQAIPAFSSVNNLIEQFTDAKLVLGTLV